MSILMIVGLVIIWLIFARRTASWVIMSERQPPSDGDIVGAYAIGLFFGPLFGPILYLCDFIGVMFKSKDGRETALRLALGKKKMQDIEKYGWRR